MLRVSGLLVLAFLFAPLPAGAFCFEDAAKTYDINPQLLKIIAMTESNFRTDAVNKNRDGTLDIGLMQINSSWIEKLDLNAARLIENPCYNALTGARILRDCIDRHGYTWEAVGCYNASAREKRIRYSWRILNKLKNVNNTPSQRYISPNEQKAEGKKEAGKKPDNTATEFYFSIK
jgi:soluble lytic murein transglycosylase-like protein